jgi:hypothetical protein
MKLLDPILNITMGTIFVLDKNDKVLSTEVMPYPQRRFKVIPIFNYVIKYHTVNS